MFNLTVKTIQIEEIDSKPHHHILIDLFDNVESTENLLKVIDYVLDCPFKKFNNIEELPSELRRVMTDKDELQKWLEESNRVYDLISNVKTKLIDFINSDHTEKTITISYDYNTSIILQII